MFEVAVVPKLIICSPSGDIISKKGRKEVEDRSVAAFRYWLSNAGISSARIKTPDFESDDIFSNVTSQNGQNDESKAEISNTNQQRLQ